MSEKREKRRVELRIVGAPMPSEPEDGGGGGDRDGGGGPGSGAPPRERPAVNIVTGWRHDALDRAERFLVKADRGLFYRGPQIVRVAPELVDIGNGELVSALHHPGHRPAHA